MTQNSKPSTKCNNKNLKGTHSETVPGMSGWNKEIEGRFRSNIRRYIIHEIKYKKLIQKSFKMFSLK